jgi:hypothetical protein
MMIRDVKRWLAYCLWFRRALVVEIKAVDDRDHSTQGRLTVLLDSRADAMTAVAEISDILQAEGMMGLNESMSEGRYRIA